MEKEIAQTTELNLVEKEDNKKTNIPLILGIIFISLILIIFIVFLGVTAFISSTDKIITGIKIKGVDVSGLTKERAITRITDDFNKNLPTNVTLIHGEYETQLNMNDMGVNFNIEKLVDEAYQEGRSGNIFSNMFTILGTMVSPKNIGLDISINNEQTTNLLNDISTKLPDTVVQSSYYVDGDNLIITKGKTGVVVDTESTINNIKNKINDLSYTNNKVELITVSKEPDSIDLNKIHSEITENKEKLEIEYISNCENKENYLKLLKERRKLDIIKGFTTKGIHRDDFMIYINEKEVGAYGSQGQNRTVVLSLKLAELNVIYDEIGEYPILLLDDFMSELDIERRKNFLNNIKNTQVILTGTEKIDLPNLEYNLYNVKKGEIV